MKTFLPIIAALAICICGFDWPSFRGVGGLSATTAVLPTTFDDEKNIAYRVELPGRGPSSPIVVGDQVIVSSSRGKSRSDEEQLFLSSYNINTGKQLWIQKFLATGRTLCHELSGNAAPTPASDGQFVYAFYSSNDLACVDLQGNLIWYRALAVDHPKAGNDVGMASSVAVADGVVVAQVQNQGESFVTGINAETGETLWLRERDTTSSWASPVVFQEPGGRWVATVQGGEGFDLLDMKTGESTSSIEGECSTVSSAAFLNGVLYMPIDGTTAYRVLSGGKLEKVWASAQMRPANASAVVHEDLIYTLGRGGVLGIFAADDGESKGKARVGGNYWGTPAIAGQHMYFFDQNGTARVVRLGEKPEVVHEHTFADEVFLCSPAVTQRGLFVRSDKYLYKISNQ